MTHFIPGSPVVQFETKDSQEVVVRYPKWEDLPQLRDFINTLSSENTYIAFAGEQLSLEEEADFLLNWFKQMEFSDGVYLVCEYREKIIGASSIERKESDRTRGEHCGIFGLTIAKEYRGLGIGENLAKATIETARTTMTNLELVTLTVFSENTPAIALYKKLGFIEFGKLPNGLKYAGRYQDSVEMYLPL